MKMGLKSSFWSEVGLEFCQRKNTLMGKQYRSRIMRNGQGIGHSTFTRGHILSHDELVLCSRTTRDHTRQLQLRYYQIYVYVAVFGIFISISYQLKTPQPDQVNRGKGQLPNSE